MIPLSTIALHSTAPPEVICQRLAALVYENPWDALADMADGRVQKAFTGRVDANGFRLFPVQRGRLLPIPCLSGRLMAHEDGSRIELRVASNLSATLSGIVFALVALVPAVLAISQQTPGLFVFAAFPLLVLFAGLYLLRREAHLALAVISAAIRVISPDEPSA